MTEEIIIDGGRMAGITTLKNKIARLEQENKEIYENGQIEITKLCNEKTNYRSALEEINITVKQLLQGVTSNCINNTPYLTALSLIENKINEVLNESK